MTSTVPESTDDVDQTLLRDLICVGWSGEMEF